MKTLPVLMTIALIMPQGQVRDPSAASSSRNAMIAGTITDDAGAVVARARVTLANAGGTVRLNGSTDDAGRFAFGGLPSGQFALQASQTGYLDAMYGRSRADGPGTFITLADGQQLTVGLRLVRGARISGRALDEEGNGLPAAMIRLYRVENSRASRPPALQPVTTAWAERDGRYRVIGLSAGDYVVAVDPGWSPDGVRRMDAGGIERTILFQQSFHPGTTRPADATIVSVIAGDERTGIDITLRPSAASIVSGTARLPDGSMPTELSVRLSDSTMTRESLSIYSSARSVGGQFVVNAVPAGRYTITAIGTVQTGPPDPQSGRGGSISYFGSGSVTTDGVVPADVTITLAPAGRVSARLTFDAHTQERPANAQQIAMSLRPAGNSSSFAQPTGAAIVLQPDGTALVTWANVPPGQYLISVASVRSVWQLASATIDGTTVLDLPIEVRSGAEVTGLSIALTDVTSPVSGVALDASGQPVAASVLLFPVDQKYWIAGSRRLTIVHGNADGRFSIPNAPPGEYYIVALASSPSESLGDPAWLIATSRLATRVTLRAGETSTATLAVR